MAVAVDSDRGSGKVINVKNRIVIKVNGIR